MIVIMIIIIIVIIIITIIIIITLLTSEGNIVPSFPLSKDTYLQC